MQLDTSWAFVPLQHLQKSNQPALNMKKDGKKDSKDTKGVYVRPSAAIERGSGFFIPGLEGPRVRLIFGLVLILLTTLNHVMGDSETALNEWLAVGYAILLLLQAAIEFGKEGKGFIVSLDPGERESEQGQASTAASLVQRWASVYNLSPEWKEKVQWAAVSYTALTPATHMLLLQNDEVLYSLGDPNFDPKQEIGGCRAALETLSKARSGRVSLPSSHPTVVALVPDARCVVLQRICDNRCWLMASSSQLLQAFTERDLRWLGQLAGYVK
jgi:hypothetical protein